MNAAKVIIRHTLYPYGKRTKQSSILGPVACGNIPKLMTHIIAIWIYLNTAQHYKFKNVDGSQRLLLCSHVAQVISMIFESD